MVDNRTTPTEAKTAPICKPVTSDTDKDIMRKIRLICSRGNNAEIKQRKDGTLAVMEVKKNIV